jgi:glycosyltransferase involved in cell wall biosynthesis
MRIAFVYYASFSSFIKRDYDIISRVHEVKKVNFSGPDDAVKLMKAVANCDLVLIWFAGGHAFAAVLLAKLLRKKSMIIVGGFDVARVPEINYGRFTQSWTKKFLTKMALQYADRVLVVDPSLKEDAIKNAGIDGHNIDYLPTGYDYEKFVPGPAKEDLVITVGYVSHSVIKRKGFDTFVQAASLLPDTKFLLIGKAMDDSVDILKGSAPPNIEFTGFVTDEELLSYYQRSKVYCQLSAYEGLPNALCEAMLCECLPVGTDRNGIPTAMGDTGFLVPFGDAEATARSIANGLKAPGIRGQNARKRIQELFPEERREKGLLQAIEELAGS